MAGGGGEEKGRVEAGGRAVGVGRQRSGVAARKLPAWEDDEGRGWRTAVGGPVEP